MLRFVLLAAVASAELKLKELAQIPETYANCAATITQTILHSFIATLTAANDQFDLESRSTIFEQTKIGQVRPVQNSQDSSLVYLVEGEQSVYRLRRQNGQLRKSVLVEVPESITIVELLLTENYALVRSGTSSVHLLRVAANFKVDPNPVSQILLQNYDAEKVFMFPSALDMEGNFSLYCQQQGTSNFVVFRTQKGLDSEGKETFNFDTQPAWVSLGMPAVSQFSQEGSVIAASCPTCQDNLGQITTFSYGTQQRIASLTGSVSKKMLQIGTELMVQAENSEFATVFFTGITPGSALTLRTVLGYFRVTSDNQGQLYCSQPSVQIAPTQPQRVVSNLRLSAFSNQVAFHSVGNTIAYSFAFCGASSSLNSKNDNCAQCDDLHSSLDIQADRCIKCENIDQVEANDQNSFVKYGNTPFYIALQKKTCAAELIEIQNQISLVVFRDAKKSDEPSDSEMAAMVLLPIVLLILIAALTYLAYRLHVTKQQLLKANKENVKPEAPQQSQQETPEKFIIDEAHSQVTVYDNSTKKLTVSELLHQSYLRSTGVKESKQTQAEVCQTESFFFTPRKQENMPSVRVEKEATPRMQKEEHVDSAEPPNDTSVSFYDVHEEGGRNPSCMPKDVTIEFDTPQMVDSESENRHLPACQMISKKVTHPLKKKEVEQ